MKTYIIETRNGDIHLRLAATHYGRLPHNDTPLAIIAYEDNGSTPGNHPETPYGTLTKNLDPWTGRKDQTGFRAFVKTHGENTGWAPELIERLIEDGTAVPTPTILPGPHGTRYRLYEFHTEKF